MKNIINFFVILLMLLISTIGRSQSNEYIINENILFLGFNYEEDCILNDIILDIELLNDSNLRWIKNTLETLSKDKFMEKQERISVLENTIFTLEKFNNSSFDNIILDLKIIVKKI